ncbi:ABC transporter permease [Limosilactobacillus sp. Sa3CUN2]|uniref:ABC transporter permease n=1 Tax=Limosilactobacillus avistercoris TaxID=2762243 RepID=A0ABR8PA80_9LACO|nr:ABC transporter permease [Limosilactobacillus avistercoris]MBD7894142.1 ABC transporter permease [Limosilactobacillus avistercoris]
MFALLKRNIKIYFNNVPGVFMSLLGALISFFIYIGFLQQNLEDSWHYFPDIAKLLDLWMIAGIVSVAGITTSFQALGQMIKDKESRKADDLRLTELSQFKINLIYVLSAALISFLMQIITLIVMVTYFKIVDKIELPNNGYLLLLMFSLLGSIAATLLNALIVVFIHSSTTFSRLSAIIGTLSGFAVAMYLPYGALSKHIQTLVKCVPSSYEATSLRSLLLNQISHQKLSASLRTEMANYLGIHFKIAGYLLSRADNAWVLVEMIIALVLIIVIISFISERKRTN